MADTTEVLAGELPSVPEHTAPATRRQLLPADELRSLAEAFAEVLESALGAGITDPRRLADRCAVYVAPWLAELGADLADARLQVEQSGDAMSGLTVEVARLGNLAHRRRAVMMRLHQSLVAAKLDADRYGALTPQTCPAGRHDGWFVPSNGRRYACPWCLIIEIAGDDEAVKAAVLADIAEREAEEEVAALAADEAAAASQEPELSAYDYDPDIDDGHPHVDGGDLDVHDDVDEHDDEHGGERS